MTMLLLGLVRVSLFSDNGSVGSNFVFWESLFSGHIILGKFVQRSWGSSCLVALGGEHKEDRVKGRIPGGCKLKLTTEVEARIILELRFKSVAAQ